MTIRNAPVLNKTQVGAHAPLFLRITTPAERRHIQTHPGETFLVPNEDSETGGWPQRSVAAIRAYTNKLNKNGTSGLLTPDPTGREDSLFGSHGTRTK